MCQPETPGEKKVQFVFMLIFMGNLLNTNVSFFLCFLILLTVDFSICSESFEVQCITSEAEALLKFKQHLKDPTNRLHSWNGKENCCKWTGVVCSNITGHVVELHLRSSPPSLDNFDDISYDQQYEAYERSRFAGEISSSLLDLKHMSYIDLSGNDFGGIRIPHFFGSMIKLTHLNLSNSNFSGMIPHQIANLTNLCYFDLNHNYHLYAKNVQWLLSLFSLQYVGLSYANLSGASDLPQVLETLPSLMELYLSSCELDKAFEPSSTNFSSLIILDLSGNYYEQFPKWIFGLRKLVSLNLIGNYFQGPIPDGIQNLTYLENLNLAFNRFNSTIPLWLFSCTHLKFLNLYYNNLGGTISNAIGNLTSLVQLVLSYNQIEGKIPRSMGNLCNMKLFGFSNLKANQEVSEILKIFSGCVSQKLETFSLTNSKLFGHLTDQIGTFINLVQLDLYNNSIQGRLPNSLGKLASLKYLSLGGNQFIGNPFKVLGSSLFELNYLSLGNNLFQGVVTEDDLANFTSLQVLSAPNNQLTLKVRPNWSPCFQLYELDMYSWHLGPNFPSWILSQKHLKLLFISNTSISDSIPLSFWNSFIHYSYSTFDLSHNQIYGQIQNISKYPIQFAIIDLSSNQLSGQLPYISPDVLYLDLSHNMFSGTITNFLCQQQFQESELEALILASNNLSGKIPDCWMGWTSVRNVRLENNYFTGGIPSSLGYLAYLEQLVLRGNKLSGKFPNSLRNCTKMTILDLGGNKLSGIVPAWIGKRLKELMILSLHSNRFSGQIPWNICRLTSLQVLDISGNDLSGHMPKCLHHLSIMRTPINRTLSYIYLIWGQQPIMVNSFVMVKGRLIEYNRTLGLLTVIDLSDNKLIGEIPKEITSLRGLLFLNLSKNLLTGRIPETIGNMRSLLSIDFSRNQLSGEIPQSITNLSFLNNLDLSFNNLKGAIPRGTQLQTFEASSFIGNELCGPPLPTSCTPSSSIHHMDQTDRAKGHGIHWFYVSMTLGFIVGFWGVVGPLFISRSWRFAYYRFLDRMWHKLRDCCIYRS